MTDFATMARIDDNLRIIADSLATIAATLTNPTARTVDLTDPNHCDPGCTRPSLHGGDCSPAEANDYAPGGWASGTVRHPGELCPEFMTGYHCTRTTHDDTRPHTWTPNEEPRHG